MKKVFYKIGLIMFFAIAYLLISNSASNAATAGISASSRSVSAGDSVSINVSVNAIAWNLKVSGSGVSDSIVGGNLDELANKSTSKSYKLNTSTPGTYTVNLSGDVTDASGTTTDVSSSVTVQVSAKSNADSNANTGNTGNTGSTDKKNEEKTTEPTFSTVNQTVYSTTEGINVRSSYSTSSSSVGTLKKGESVTRIGVSNNGWSKVKYNGAIAYISSSLLTTTKPEEEDKSDVKALKSLVISPGTLSPEFNAETTKYTMSVGADVDKLNIEALLEDEKSKLSISGNDSLEMGENTVKIVVTAEDETARTYTIIVTKEEQEQIKLSTLTIKGVELDPKFDPSVYEYTVEVDSSVSKLDIQALCDVENATVEILGNEDLTIGENTITIMVKSEDGKQNVTYQIVVNKTDKTDKAAITQNTTNTDDNMKYIIVGGVLGTILLIIIIVLIVKKVRKNKSDDGIELNFIDDIKKMDEGEDKLDFYKQDSNDNKSKEDYKDDGYIEMNTNSSIKTNKLYNIEDEVDFSDVDKDKKRRKKGIHF